MNWSAEKSEKNGYDFFAKKKFRQPKVVREILNAYIDGETIHFPNLNFKEDQLKNISRFIIQAANILACWLDW